MMGLEQPSHSRLLEEQGMTHAGISFWSLKRRLPKTKPYVLADRFPESFTILLDSGGYSANKTPTSVGDLEDYAATYEEFVVKNLDRVSLVTEFDCLALGPAWIEEQRKTFWNDVPPEKFVPIWHGGMGTMPELHRLAQVYDNVGIPESALEQHANLAVQINGLQSKYGTRFHALASAKPDNLHAVRFDTAATTSWLSPAKYGETIVWDGTKLHRYTSAQKDQARKRHKGLFERAGFDAAKILADNHEEVTRFTLWSFRQLEANVDKRRPTDNPFTVIPGGKDEVVTNMGEEPNEPFAQVPPPAADNSLEVSSNSSRRVVVPRDASEERNFPGMTIHTKGGEGSAEGGTERQVMGRTTESLRLCDFCYVKETCPAFKPMSTCAFKFPVEFKTKEQIEAGLQIILEMQMERVAFMYYAEQQNGGYADPNLSQEIDRQVKLTEKIKEIKDNSSYLKMSIQARGETSYLEQVFGSDAKMMRDQGPDMGTRVERMLDTGIIDADIIE